MDIDKFANGNLIKQIREGIKEILNNIADDRTPSKARRCLTIKITFRPNKDRKNIKIFIETKINKAPVRSTEANMFIGQNTNGEPVFYNSEVQIPGQISIEKMEGG
ncbi:hypothetical protein [Anaerocolumna xylanovorans]|uniref:Phage protein n=1 Tax=Anaerocolumna xylanovorans DSM 12503 TaxID=1121345 RepID=A0A1M7YC29_9FIRM|nr:hypothetical protein [Anaerocolumna xylanovorans]SHO50136.1 hypothetical protein SAMN02745217_02601 [Anaerocolumna xylanovorans DSM 12503]